MPLAKRSTMATHPAPPQSAHFVQPDAGLSLLV
jgi:hypothetical protein